MIPASGAFVNPGQDTFKVRPVNSSTALHCPLLVVHLGDVQVSCLLALEAGLCYRFLPGPQRLGRDA